MTQCPRCGNSDRIEKASVIVERETHYSTVTRGVALGDGKYGTIQQGVTSQSERAQALTADAPKEGNGCWGTLLVGFLLLYPTAGILLSCMGLTYMHDYYGNQGTAILLLVSVLVFIAIIVISNIVSRQQKNNFNRRYQSWYNMFDRRYYCSNCGNIMQF